MGAWVLFALLHIPLALLMSKYPLIATAAAILAGFVGVLFALDNRRPERVMLAAAYITGADVLWRMTEAGVAWQYGKYLIAALLLLALLVRRPAPRMGAALVYFLLLLPSTTLTLFNLSWAQAWVQIDFNLSGPLALAVCLWFFDGARIDRRQALQITLAVLAPVVGEMTLAAAGVLTSTNIVFTSYDSNFATSGGYLPNETSTTLGLAALLCFIGLLLLRPPAAAKVFLGLTLPVALTQTALTFSRSGLLFFAAGALAATLIALCERRTRRAALAIAGALLLVGVFIIPGLARFTDATILARFTDLDSSGRAEATRAEISVWIANPLLGVGPGMADEARGRAAQAANGILVSHNEFTRMAAEHGLAGMAGVIILAALVWRGLRRSVTIEALAWNAALASWAVASLLVVDFRTAAAAFLLGVSAAGLDFSAQPADHPERAGAPPVTTVRCKSPTLPTET